MIQLPLVTSNQTLIEYQNNLPINLPEISGRPSINGNDCSNPDLSKIAEIKILDPNNYPTGKPEMIREFMDW